MRNSYQDLTPNTFLESFLDFCKKVLLPILVILMLLVWASFETKAYAKDVIKKVEPVDKFYLVQEYVGKKSLDTSKPHRLSCVGKVCTLFSEDKKVKNFFSDKNCVEKKEGEEGDKVSEFSCTNSNTIKRVMILSRDEYLRFLLTPKEEVRGKLST